MSTGRFPLIVNCGAPGPDHEDWRSFARSTQAHSTLTFEDAPSAEFTESTNGAGTASRGVLTGPQNVQGSLGQDEQQGFVIKASHGGYATRFGAGHSRKIAVDATGLMVSGEDSLAAAKGLLGSAYDGGGSYAIRFHLHPCVSARVSADGQSVELVLPNREAWRLSSNAPLIELDDSVFLADERGPQQSTQVVLSGSMDGEREVHISWVIEQIAAAGEGSLTNPNEAPDAA
jgi:uncharacterized heparinase superfamily protein